MRRGFASGFGSVPARIAEIAVVIAVIVTAVAVAWFVTRPAGHRPATGPSKVSVTSPGPNAHYGSSSAVPMVSCRTPTVTVSDAAALAAALDAAKPGDTIGMRAGTYIGEFTAKTSGTATKPISLCGTTQSVLSTGNAQSGYGLHLDHASYWNLVGFSVRLSQKGVVIDASAGVTIQKLTVSEAGEEGIHLRQNSSDNVLVGNTVRDTGTYKSKFGEGIYIGSAQSNWCAYTGCEPDRSDRNTIRANTISHTSAESIDVKEGTSSGLIELNSFNGTAMTGADSWVDVKGSGWTIRNNIGVAAPQDGYQTHVIVDGWGDRNTFTGNVSQVNAPGYAIHLTKILENRISCDNTAIGAGAGLSNAKCSG